tara:strand:+ start:2679 stop:3611 length:933 start_codon:yes stop_codon:yes gene_type:complete
MPKPSKKTKKVVNEKSEMDIRVVLKESTDLSDESLDAIEEAFDTAVAERSALHVKKALLEQDSEYTEKLDQLLEAIDIDRTKKAKHMLTALDKDRTKKLQAVVERYDKVLNEDAKVFKESLVDTISNYLDKFLIEHVPVDDIKAAARNKKAVKLVANLREALFVDKATSIKSVRDGIVEGKTKLDEANAELARLKKHTTKLVKENTKLNASLILEEKTSALPEDVKGYITKMLGSKTPEFIKENFDYTVQMFDASEEERLETLKEQATRQRKVTVEPKQSAQIIEEKSEPTPKSAADPSVGGYLGELARY